MFIKTSKNSAGQVYHYLVESYRENGKTRHRTLLSLGRAEENRIDNLLTAISKHRDVLDCVQMAQCVSVHDTFILGPLLFLRRLFEKTGIDEILEKISMQHPKLGFNLRNIVFTMAVSRFVNPGSKLKVYEHWQRRFYPEMVDADIELHQYYRALDVLAKHKEDIEVDLYWRGRDLLNMEVDVVLYDLTTLRFESVREDIGELRRFGFSKEKRSDCTQVILGLLVDPDGIPLGFEVYPGNTFEGKTVADIVDKMRTKFKIRRFIFVGDRGLFSRENIEALRGPDKRTHGEFIIGMKLGLFKKRQLEFFDLSRYTWINENLAVYETTHEGDRCIITWSRSRAERDRKAREDILNKIRAKIEKKTVTTKTFVTNKAWQRYVVGLNSGKKFEINAKAVAEDQLRDGYFGVLTNVTDMKAEEIIKNYKQLWIIEDAFGEIKGTLKARPVFVWTDRRIIGHLVLCFLAYLCEAMTTKLLREKKIMLQTRSVDDGTIKSRPLTVAEAMKELSEIRAVPVQIRSQTVWVRTDINGNAAKLFSAIGLRASPKVLNLEKNQKRSGTNKNDHHECLQ